jgi:Family of unknown function (DUF6492)
MVANISSSTQNLRPTQQSGTVDDSSSFAIVTPTYWRDLTRCELLVESLDRCAPSVPHYLIIDRRDLPTFAHLDRGQHKIVESESLLDKDFWQMPGRSGWWLSLRAPPVRGWIMQQIKKIAAIKAIPEQTLVFCDSDSAFLRHFRRANLLVQEKMGLLDVNYVNDDIRQWTAAARRLLGLPQSEDGYRNHVGYLICWNRETVEALQRRIEHITKTRWQMALARSLNFSEYTLYGVFVREVLGYDATNHAPSDVPLIKTIRGRASKNGSEIDNLFSDFDPQTIGIMVHSKDGIEPHQFRHRLEEQWRNLA